MLIDCNTQSNNANNDSTKAKKVFVCNILHLHHPLSSKSQRVRVAGGDLCEAEAPTEAAAETNPLF